MLNGWRGRAIGLAIVAGLLAGSAPERAAGVAEPPPAWQLVVRDADGEPVLDLLLPDGRFALRYRNSVYGTPAEEHFVIVDGRIVLDELRADDPAVLAEYYAVAERPRPFGNAWRARPAAALRIGALTVAATDHGERTLVIRGHPPMPLWPLVGDGPPGLTLTVRPAP